MKYLFFLKRALKNNTIYRFDYFLGCLNVCIQIFISCEIWKALYITNHVSGKVSLNVVLTSFIINLGLSNIYSIDDLTVQRKFCDGTIICELLKPINYRIYLLADTVGNILFKLLFNLIPCSAIMIIVYRNYFIFCINSCSLCVFFLSIILGFMVLWEISSIVQMLCFWIVNVWSISTIKDVFINVLAGTILPVWYLPEAIQNIIKYTPFAAREIVFLGTQEFVEQTRENIREEVMTFIRKMNMDAYITVAADAFIMPKMIKYKKYQKMEKSKYEVRVSYDKDHTLAAASLNLHGTAFTSPFHIKVKGVDNPVSGCVGFGIERWILVFLAQYGTDSACWPDEVKKFIRQKG